MLLMHRKWSRPGVPHRGWTCVDVDDLGEPSAICEMCEQQEIRYVHHMQHPGYAGELEVGCVCAGRMEEDYERPRKRERNLRNAAQRRRRWLSRKWKTSGRGNAYINTDGLNITIFQNDDGSWGGRIMDRATDQVITARRRYASEDKAKLAAFDVMIFLKTRGMGPAGLILRSSRFHGAVSPSCPAA